jgi:hypothetical protein
MKWQGVGILEPPAPVHFLHILFDVAGNPVLLQVDTDQLLQLLLSEGCLRDAGSKPAAQV